MRTMHFKLDEHTLVGCLDFLDQHSIRTDNKPIGTALRLFLESVVSSMREQGILPNYANATEVDRRLKELIGAEEAPKVNMDFSNIKPVVADDTTSTPASPPSDVIEGVGNLVKEIIESKRSESDDSDDLVINKEVEKVEKASVNFLASKTPPWETSQRKDFDECKEYSEAKLIVAFVSSFEDPIKSEAARHAAEVIFAAFPRASWNQEFCRENVIELFNRFHSWMIAHKNEKSS